MDWGKDNYKLEELKEAYAERGLKTWEEIIYDKYMVISNNPFDKNNIYGVFDNELEAYKKFKGLQKSGTSVIKANVTYFHFGEKKLIHKYEETKKLHKGCYKW